MDYIGVFQGGGMKGIAYAGAYLALEENGFHCKKAVGTSIGAVFAGMIIAGYTGKELIQILEKLNFSSLLYKQPNNIKNIINDKGLYHTLYIEQTIMQLLSKKGIYTFNDVRLDNDYKLKVIGTDIKKYRPIIFPNDLIKYQIFPSTFSVARAITMSATYPGFFKPIKLSDTYVIDGGVVNNFPIEVCSYTNQDIVIGFKIQNKDNKKIFKNYYNVLIDTSGYKVLDFKMDKQKQWELFLKGYNEGKKVASKIINDFTYNS